MNFSPSKEQQELRERIISFAAKELNGHLPETKEQREAIVSLRKACAGQLLTGLPVPKEYGGAGLDPESTILALEALGYGSRDGGFNFSLCAQLLACTVPLQKFGTEEQKSTYLPLICKGEIVVANAITEDGAGSDISSMRAFAKKENGTYILNGTKSYISNGPDADILIVYAMTDRVKGYHGGITAFIVDKKASGVKAGPEINKMGLNSCRMSELSFENVTLKEEHVLGGIGGGAAVFNHSMEWERAGIAACQAGTMEHLIETCITFANEHTSGGEPIGKKQAVAHRIANMQVQLEAARMLVYKAAQGLDRSRENTIHTSIAKLFTSEAFIHIASEAVQLHGARGYISSTGIERILRDATASTIYSGTSDIQRNIIASWKGL